MRQLSVDVLFTYNDRSSKKRERAEILSPRTCTDLLPDIRQSRWCEISLAFVPHLSMTRRLEFCNSLVVVVALANLYLPLWMSLSVEDEFLRLLIYIQWHRLSIQGSIRNELHFHSLSPHPPEEDFNPNFVKASMFMIASSSSYSLASPSTNDEKFSSLHEFDEIDRYFV